MPEPISSSSVPASSSYDPTLDEDGQVCRADAPNSSQAASHSVATAQPPAAPLMGVGKLLSAVPPAASALPPPSKPAAPSTAHNNAERTSERRGIAPYASAGRVGDTYAVYAGVAGIKGHDPKSGLDAEVLSVSGQVGTQTEVQVGLVRVGGSTSAGSVGVEAMTARVSFGIHNDDGSVGVNAGVQTAALGGETTCGTVDSLTVGVSAGPGVAGSLGVRDLDKNGKHELCAKVSYGPITVGACVETPF
jgi:hypothetical protein